MHLEGPVCVVPQSLFSKFTWCNENLEVAFENIMSLSNENEQWMAIPPFSFEWDKFPTNMVTYDHRNCLGKRYLGDLSKGPWQRSLRGLLMFCFWDGAFLYFARGYPSDPQLLAILEQPRVAVASMHPPLAPQAHRCPLIKHWTQP